MLKIAFLASGSGSNFEACLEHIERNGLQAETVGLISNSAKAYCHERAKKHGVKSFYISGADGRYDEKLVEVLHDIGAEYIVLAGYLKTVAPSLIAEYENRIINIHPSLIPSFCGKGYYGARVHEAVYNYGVKVSGATVHFVSAGLDEGPIILQKSVELGCEDGPKEIAAKVLKIEHEILPRAIELLAENRITVLGRRVEVCQK